MLDASTNDASVTAEILSWGPGGPWPLLNLKSLHGIVIFAIELQFSKVAPLLSVASSTGAILITISVI